MNDELKHIGEKIKAEQADMKFEFKDSYWDEALVGIKAAERTLFWKRFYIWFGAFMLAALLFMYLYNESRHYIKSYSPSEHIYDSSQIYSRINSPSNQNYQENYIAGAIELNDEAFFEYLEMENELMKSNISPNLKIKLLDELSRQKDTVFIEKIIEQKVYVYPSTKTPKVEDNRNFEFEKLQHFYDSVLAIKAKRESKDEINSRPIKEINEAFYGDIYDSLMALNDSIENNKKFHFYIQSGINISKGMYFKNDEGGDFLRTQEIDPLFGLDIHYSFNEKFELGLGLNWWAKTLSNVEVNLNHKTYGFGSEDSTKLVNMEKTFNLEIPVSVHYNLYKNLWVNGGISVSSLLGAKGIESILHNTTTFSSEEDVVSLSNSKSVTYNNIFSESDLQFQIGAEYRHQRTSIMIKYFYGTGNIGKKYYFDNINQEVYNRGVRIGLRYRFLDLN